MIGLLLAFALGVLVGFGLLAVVLWLAASDEQDIDERLKRGYGPHCWP